MCMAFPTVATSVLYLNEEHTYHGSKTLEAPGRAPSAPRHPHHHPSGHPPTATYTPPQPDIHPAGYAPLPAARVVPPRASIRKWGRRASPLNATMQLSLKPRPIPRCIAPPLASPVAASPQRNQFLTPTPSQRPPELQLPQPTHRIIPIRARGSCYRWCRGGRRRRRGRTGSSEVLCASGSRSNVTMPNPQAPTWKAALPHSGKPKIEPNEINDLLYANMKRRSDAEERHDVEMNGSNGYANLDLSPAPAPSVPRMRASRPKTVKQAKNCPLTPGPSGTGSPTSSAPTPTSTCRYDSSLGLLTKKFIDLIKQADDGVLDLNKAADTLHVQKRRIYDITNVLEGIGLIEKKLKNRIRWKGLGMARAAEAKDDAAGLQAEVDDLRKQEIKLDESISEMRERLRSLSEDEHNKQWLYVTEDDIKNLPCFQNETLIAIKAPLGTTLEVPDPDEAVEYPHRRFQILLRSTMGPIDVYLVSRFEGKFEEMNSTEVPMEVGQPVPQAMAGPSSSANAMSHQGNMDIVPEASYGLSDLGPPVSQDLQSASQISEPTGSDQAHPDFAGGIMRIAPAEVNTDTDYWLLSDAGVGISDMWRSDPSNAMWDEVVRLNAEFGIENIGSPRPHTPPSSNALEVDPVS